MQLTKSRFMLNERRLTVDVLCSATVIYRIDDLKGEDAAAFNTWYKALFDSQIEGIEDSVLRYDSFITSLACFLMCTTIDPQDHEACSK